ncbi:BMP family ABC transporter substrate-binding protein [Nocardioides dongxiaopingii]|uniref:BMP family lipoprotein n=1 Tax=Nocardioides TaxID=1839 RepID=UPI0010C76A14|nr:MULTISPECIES: BMP family ABC transporter substrate-binding protein [Nocardioides]QCW50184.1 BMP family ABC transporter substrate-binding protein [Nocardioides sp. S-1144]
MKIRKSVLGGISALTLASALVACGDAPDDSAGDDETKTDFLPCIVSDAGGFDDKSFNQLGFEGLVKAADELGAEYKDVESNSENDYAPNLTNLVDQGCDAIVTVGFALSAATVESAKANPDIEYILIDDAADNDFDGTKDADNIKPLLYDTAQAAFLAGYAAADYSKTGTVGTYGGQPFPTVTIFMDGYRQGVEYYNEQKGADVKVAGWDGENGSFTGGFEANEKATNTATQILGQDVDVILPVGGPIYEGALTAIADSGSDAVMVGTDADVFESDPKTQDVILTSIMKNMDVSTYDAIMAAGNDEFDAEAYVGTLENDGVAIAPFHNFETEVNESLQGELDEIKAGIIDGSIPVTSYLTP